MSEFFIDSNDAGDGSFYVDSAGTLSVPAQTYLLDSFDAGDGSIYYDSLQAVAAVGSFYYFLMMQ